SRLKRLKGFDVVPVEEVAAILLKAHKCGKSLLRLRDEVLQFNEAKFQGCDTRVQEQPGIGGREPQIHKSVFPDMVRHQPVCGWRTPITEVTPDLLRLFPKEADVGGSD